MLRACLCLALVLCVGCGPATEREPARPGARRIVALSPSITRVLIALGATHELVAVDRFSKELPAVAHLPALGGVFNPDLERTIELDPTIVLAVRSVQQEPFFDQLRARGVEITEIEPYTLKEVLDSFLLVGSRVGRATQAEALVREVHAELGAIGTSVQGRRPRSVALVLEHDPLYVAGGGAFINDLIKIAGGSNVFSDFDEPYPRISLETLASRAPELILDAYFDPQAAEASQAEIRAFWQRFDWVKRVEPFPPNAAILPSPNLAEGARALRARIHPEVTGP